MNEYLRFRHVFRNADVYKRQTINRSPELVCTNTQSISILLNATLENRRQLLTVLSAVCLWGSELVRIHAKSIGIRGNSM